MNDITELSLLVGRIDQKQDQQIALLKELKDGQTDLNSRVMTIENSRKFLKTFWTGAVAAVSFLGGWFHGAR